MPAQKSDGHPNLEFGRAFQFSNARGSSKLRATTAKPPQGRFTQPPQGGFAPVARDFQLPGNEMIKL